MDGFDHREQFVRIDGPLGPWLQRFIAWRLIAVTDSNHLAELLAQ
jgi:hypothetical protein